MICKNCGLLISQGTMGYSGPVCQCTYKAMGNHDIGTQIVFPSKTNQELLAKLHIAVEALKIYSDGNNWRLGGKCDMEYHWHDPLSWAREALEKIGESWENDV